MSVILAGLFRYPVKGLGGEALENAALGFHAALPGDRAFAPVRLGPPPVLLRKPAIATLDAMLEGTAQAVEGTSRLTLSHQGVPIASADPASEAGRRELAAGLASALGILDPLDLVAAGSFRGGYQGPGSLSVMAAASVRALGEALDLPALDPRRFRSNLVLEGLEPNRELDWRGRHLRLGEAELRITGPIRRCRIIDTSPCTGERDLALLAKLAQDGATPLLGVYAEVTKPGRIAPGDSITLLD